MEGNNHKLITILGATASGKTSLASNLAYRLDAEIISADSRQVYRGMTIGTGKDLEDYIVKGKTIPSHLVDIAEAGYKYNVYEYQRDFLEVYKRLRDKDKQIILCGGSGMYLEAILKSYKLINVPNNQTLRDELEDKSDDELSCLLDEMRNLHNVSDTSTRKRLVRAIEISKFYNENPDIDHEFPKIESVIFGVKFDRGSRRRRITHRLRERLKSGMIEEVEELLKKGLTPEQLVFYGLEYKYLTNYVTGYISYDEMFSGLNTAIHQFSKRQMTWFRKMEKDGFSIKWLDGYMSLDDKLESIYKVLNK